MKSNVLAIYNEAHAAGVSVTAEVAEGNRSRSCGDGCWLRVERRRIGEVPRTVQIPTALECRFDGRISSH
jgi:hypothetical protein